MIRPTARRINLVLTIALTATAAGLLLASLWRGPMINIASLSAAMVGFAWTGATIEGLITESRKGPWSH